MIWLATIAVLVGVLIGAVGVGGVLLIPALAWLTPLSMHASMATALFTFVFTGLVASVLFQRRGSIDWSLTLPLCAGGALFGFVGAWVNSRVDASMLALILALLITLAGLYTLLGHCAGRPAPLAGRPGARRWLLFAVGAATGFGSGLTGVGGPAISVPIMVLLGFPALAAVGAGQVVQVLAAISGSAGNLVHGQIDFHLAAILTLLEVLGVVLGVKLAHAVNAATLRRVVGVLCVAVGVGVALRFA